MNSNEPLSKEGYELIGAAFEVHNEIGGGLLEEIYQECLELELKSRGVPFVAQELVKTFYKGQPLKKKYVPDLLVRKRIFVELKSTAKFVPENEMQLLNYMRLCQIPIGYLINFGPIKELEWKRYILSEYLNEEERNSPTG